MEPRILLAADLAVDVASIFPERDDNDLLVRMIDETITTTEGAVTVQRVQVLDAEGGAVLAFGDLSEISGIAIEGGDGADRLTFDADSFGGLTTPDLSFDGGLGQDTLVFDTSLDASWNVTADDFGTATDGLATVSFEGVENLEGAAGNEDTFVIVGAATVTGNVAVLERGGGILNLSGTLTISS